MKAKSFFLGLFFIGSFLSIKSNAQSWVTGTGSGAGNLYTSTTTANVGIGMATTTATIGKLQVVGTSRTSTATGTGSTIGYVDLIPATGTSTPTSLELRSGGTGSANPTTQIDFQGSGTTYGTDYKGRISYTDGTGFALYSSVTPSYKVTIAETGTMSIGIGATALFGTALNANGNAQFSYGTGYVQLAATAATIDIGSTGSASSIDFKGSTHLASDYWGRLKYTDGTGFDFIVGGSSNVVRLKEDGKVVIGNPSTVTSPSGYLLFVDEGILTEKVKVALCCTTDWSDFVFDPDYEMLPLDSVEKFVNANCHLPGVPSADEMVKEGIDVAKMDALLLQKIEELTLYMIQLRKENDELKSEIEELKKK